MRYLLSGLGLVLLLTALLTHAADKTQEAKPIPKPAAVFKQPQPLSGDTLRQIQSVGQAVLTSRAHVTVDPEQDALRQEAQSLYQEVDQLITEATISAPDLVQGTSAQGEVVVSAEPIRFVPALEEITTTVEVDGQPPQTILQKQNSPRPSQSSVSESFKQPEPTINVAERVSNKKTRYHAHAESIKSRLKNKPQRRQFVTANARRSDDIDSEEDLRTQRMNRTSESISKLETELLDTLDDPQNLDLERLTALRNRLRPKNYVEQVQDQALADPEAASHLEKVAPTITTIVKHR